MVELRRYPRLPMVPMTAKTQVTRIVTTAQPLTLSPRVRLTPVNTGAAACHTGLLEVLHNGVWGSVCSSVRPRLISSAP